MTQLTVDLDNIRAKMDSLQATRTRLMQNMAALDNVMRLLTSASWVSMAARAFLSRYQALQRQIQESIRRVDEYHRDLNTAFNVYSSVEQRLTQQASALRTDVFGV